MQKLLKPFTALKTKPGYTIFAGMMVILFSSWIVLDQAKSEVDFVGDGYEIRIQTESDIVRELLDDLGVDACGYDEITHGEIEAIVEVMVIGFEKADNVLLAIEFGTQEDHCTAVIVGHF